MHSDPLLAVEIRRSALGVDAAVLVGMSPRHGLMGGVVEEDPALLHVEE
jgi:hypothetical protein